MKQRYRRQTQTLSLLPSSHFPTHPRQAVWMAEETADNACTARTPTSVDGNCNDFIDSRVEIGLASKRPVVCS